MPAIANTLQLLLAIVVQSGSIGDLRQNELDGYFQPVWSMTQTHKQIENISLLNGNSATVGDLRRKFLYERTKSPRNLTIERLFMTHDKYSILIFDKYSYHSFQCYGKICQLNYFRKEPIGSNRNASVAQFLTEKISAIGSELKGDVAILNAVNDTKSDKALLINAFIESK